MLCSTATQLMDVQHPSQNLPDLIDMVFGALNPQLRRHLHTSSASYVHESRARLDVVVIDPQRWTMLQRPQCAEGWWPIIGRMLIHLVVQALVDDAFVVQALQLVKEAFDVGRDFFREVYPW